ncbi:MAG: formylmethanofuran dehydrogenase subunit C [Gemmatimonadetes bacterium]|nr:MAG: formylmethanofuran dehydrogenase subunit C [Gemmatimonadota bacterium]
MSLAFTLRTPPTVPLEAEVLTPARLAGLSAPEAAKLSVVHGNERADLGEFFQVQGTADGGGAGEFRLTGDLSRVKHVGAGMADGRIVIHGSVGMHLGAEMTGGEIIVEGDAADWVGPEMTGGRIVIKGNAGHMVGAASRGSAVGVRGGEIVVFGNTGNEAGHGMRRGLVAIGGDAGDFAGVSMLAGTIVVLGSLGWRAGAGMRRGSIVTMHPVELLPTFSYACTYAPLYLRLLLARLRRLGLPVADAQVSGRYQRWSGDAVELNKGEVLILEA